MSTPTTIKIEMLPEHILQKVFSYLTFQEKLKICLVCKYFNEIVEQSNTLMSNVAVTWRGSDWLRPDEYNDLDRFFHTLLRSKRKYQIFRIHGKIFHTFLNVIENFEDSLKTLELNDCKLNMNQLTELLKITRNLENFQCKTDFEISGGNIEEMIEERHLRNFKYKGPWINFDLIKCKKLNLFEAIITSSCPDCTGLQNFLLNVEDLRCLKIPNLMELDSLFTVGFVNKLKFKHVTELWLHSISLSEDLGIIELIKQQKNLRILELAFGVATSTEFTNSLVDAILNLEQLNKLQLLFHNFTDFRLKYRKPLSIEYFGYGISLCNFDPANSILFLQQLEKFTKLMPLLKEIKIGAGCKFENNDLRFINDLKSLEKFNVGKRCSASVLEHLQLSNLKLISTNVNYKNFQEPLPGISDESFLTFLQNHSNLKEIDISHFPQSETIWDLLLKRANSFKSIVFNVHQVTPEIQERMKFVENKYRVKFKKLYRSIDNSWAIFITI